MTTPGRECAEYVPIADYALIGNCRTAALISRAGSIDWYCPDRFDSPAMFCRVLDAHRGGYFSVSPVGDFTAERSYLDDTNILKTTHRKGETTVAVTDFMPVDRSDVRGALTDPNDIYRIVRRIEVVAGEAEITISFKPTCDYGLDQPSAEAVQGMGVLARCGDTYLGLACPAESLRQQDGQTWEARVCLRQGDRHDLALVRAPNRETAVRALQYETGDQDLERTRAFWETWASRCTYRGPYRADVIRSALALKLLTYDPSGALVAAPTTSLPEHMGGVRNWDYRYTWLRDSSLILYALLTLSYHQEAERFLDWLRNVIGRHLGQVPQIMYTIDGKGDIPEKTLDQLDGYCGSRPVRIGNAASKQRQIDIYGEVLISAYIHYHHGTTGEGTWGTAPEEGTWRVLRALVNDAAKLWKEPDEGIWEVRGGPRHFVYSKLMCWAAVDRGIRIAQEHGLDADLSRWESVRDEIRKAIEQHGYNAKLGAFVQAFGSDTLDAAVLAIPRVGFLSATDPRVLSTIDRIQHDLTQDGLVYRYRAPDGLAGGEGAFLICSFWLVEALALAGRMEEARQLFERMLRRQNDVGLYSEEIDPATGAFLGNFPQGFTHLALIRAAVDLARADKHGAEEHAHTEGERAVHAKQSAAEGHG